MKVYRGEQENLPCEQRQVSIMTIRKAVTRIAEKMAKMFKIFHEIGIFFLNRRVNAYPEMYT